MYLEWSPVYFHCHSVIKATISSPTDLLHLSYSVTPHPVSFLFSPAPLSSKNDLWTHIFDHVTFHLKPFCCSYVHWLPDSQLLSNYSPSISLCLQVSVYMSVLWGNLPILLPLSLTTLAPDLCSMTHFSFEAIFTAVCLSVCYEDRRPVCLTSYPGH